MDHKLLAKVIRLRKLEREVSLASFDIVGYLDDYCQSRTICAIGSLVAFVTSIALLNSFLYLIIPAVIMTALCFSFVILYEYEVYQLTKLLNMLDIILKNIKDHKQRVLCEEDLKDEDFDKKIASYSREIKSINQLAISLFPVRDKTQATIGKEYGNQQ